jgi:hypothetical protein
MLQIDGKEASGDGVAKESDGHLIPTTPNNTYVTPTSMLAHNKQTNHAYLNPHQKNQSEPCDYISSSDTCLEQATLPTICVSGASGGGRDFCLAGITRRLWSDIVCRL